MSRRGRAYGGYGGRVKAGHTRIAGSDFAVDEGIEESLKSRVQPTPLFPHYEPAQPKPLSEAEDDRVTKFLDIRKRFREGPLFTVLAENDKASDFNPFEGMEVYSRIYAKRARHLPDLKSIPTAVQLMPPELWSVFDPATKSRTKLAKSGASAARNAGESNLDILEDDDEGVENAEDEEPVEEELDDEYDSEEDEMAGDYNAEQYFDDGGDDAGDDYDAGEGDGDVYS